MKKSSGNNLFLSPKELQDDVGFTRGNKFGSQVSGQCHRPTMLSPIISTLY